MWSLSKHANLNIYFLNLAYLLKPILLQSSVVFGIYNFSQGSVLGKINTRGITTVMKREFQAHKIIALSFA